MALHHLHRLNPMAMFRKKRESHDQEFFTCEICTESMPLKRVFSNNLECFHPFCRDCIVKYIQVQVESNLADIKCPEPSCDKPLDHYFCRMIIPEALFVKWLKVKQQRVLNIRSSSSGSINNKVRQNGPVVGDRNDALFEMLVKRKGWTRCYNCGVCVEKIDGCLKMHCRCGAVFCYYCGKAYHILHTCTGSRASTRASMTPIFNLLALLTFVYVIAAFIILGHNQRS